MNIKFKTTDYPTQFIAADGGFDAAFEDYLINFHQWYRSLGSFMKVMSSSFRQKIMRNILRLHFINTTGNSDYGCSMQKLLWYTEPQPSSPFYGLRLLRTVVARAELTGHITVSKGSFDHRLKIIRPTEKWLLLETERHEEVLRSFTFLDLARVRPAVLPRGAALVASMAALEDLVESEESNSVDRIDIALSTVAALDGGLATALAIANAFVRGNPSPLPSEIAASYRISQSQARKILKVATEHSLILLEPGGNITNADDLVLASRRYVAHELSTYWRTFKSIKTVPDKEIGSLENRSELSALNCPGFAGGPNS